MKRRRIKTKPDDPAKMQISGWFDGKRTYIWFGDEQGFCIGTLGKRKLYRLARAITNQFEGI